MVHLLMKFAEKNRGMARVMVGDALVLEHVRLQQRMNLFFDKFEASLKQCLRDGGGRGHPHPDPGAAGACRDAGGVCPRASATLCAKRFQALNQPNNLEQAWLCCCAFDLRRVGTEQRLH
jgi:hypothetical protein